MDLEFIDILRVLWRRAWIIALIVAVTSVALWFGLRAQKPMYGVAVKLQITAPEPEPVTSNDQYRSISLRDEITIARNNFGEVLNSTLIYSRTVSTLGLDDNTKYELEVELVRDADFINVTVGAQSPDLAALIANTHVLESIAYYGELRAKPIQTSLKLFAEQLSASEQELQNAEGAFAKFKDQYGINVSLETELASQQNLLEQLLLKQDLYLLEDSVRATDTLTRVNDLIAERQIEMDALSLLEPLYNVLEEKTEGVRAEYRRLLSEYDDLVTQVGEAEVDAQIAEAEQAYKEAEDAFADFRSRHSINGSLDGELAAQQKLLEQLLVKRDQLILQYPASEATLLLQVEALISARQSEMNRLAALIPTYNLLGENVQQARERYRHDQDKVIEAEVKVNIVQAANFIQIVEPATASDAEASGFGKYLILGVGGSLGASVLLVFLIEYISGFRAATEMKVVGKTNMKRNS